MISGSLTLTTFLLASMVEYPLKRRSSIVLQSSQLVQDFSMKDHYNLRAPPPPGNHALLLITDY